MLKLVRTAAAVTGFTWGLGMTLDALGALRRMLVVMDPPEPPPGARSPWAPVKPDELRDAVWNTTQPGTDRPYDYELVCWPADKSATISSPADQ